MKLSENALIYLKLADALFFSKYILSALADYHARMYFIIVNVHITLRPLGPVQYNLANLSSVVYSLLFVGEARNLSFTRVGYSLTCKH
jgi:hypothetical protein